MADNDSTADIDSTQLGTYLKSTRLALGLTLRGVEDLTGKQVTNGYLSQIESGTAKRPSPRVLYHLAQAYDLDYGDLLARAGVHVPRGEPAEAPTAVAGVPLRALEELDDDERAQLLDYLAFLRSRRQSRAT